MKKILVVVIMLSFVFSGCSLNMYKTAKVEKVQVKSLETKVDKLEIEKQVTVLADGQLQVLEIIKIMEDGKRISSTNHRKVIAPGDDVSAETGNVKLVADAVHTVECKGVYAEKVAIAEALANPIVEEPVDAK
jgi:long-subunit acyl-CoA synthetase (AMP-forming)